MSIIGDVFDKPTIRLRVIRQALDLTQSTFARFLNICPNTLHRWEYKGFVFTHKQRERFRFVGINAQWLEYGTDNPLYYDLKTVREKIIFSINREGTKNA